ncbi:MAG TPA: PilZ domain-containing protein [Acidobacteriota bacterium]|nr:PilZ domain-containing protein [Acidobacteriota bacterium]
MSMERGDGEVAKKGCGMQEQRINSRLRTCLACEVRCGGSDYSGYLLSVSLTGALVSSNFDPPKGTPILISLKLPALAKTVSFNGQVVRSYKGNFSLERIYHFGVRFNAITPDSMLLVKSVNASWDPSRIVKNDRVYERSPRRVPE